jgi:hypothetical protein
MYRSSHLEIFNTYPSMNDDETIEIEIEIKATTFECKITINLY